MWCRRIKRVHVAQMSRDINDPSCTILRKQRANYERGSISRWYFQIGFNRLEDLRTSSESLAHIRRTPFARSET